jgi:release factor glutamine methyltransferase
MTLAQALEPALDTRQGAARIDAQQLLLLALERDPHDRAWLLAHDDDPCRAAASALAQPCRQRHQPANPWPTCAANRRSSA